MWIGSLWLTSTKGRRRCASLNQSLRKPARLRKLVEGDIERGTLELERIVAATDGLQRTARPLSNARHYSNSLFNVMRGGIFSDGYKPGSGPFCWPLWPMRTNRLLPVTSPFFAVCPSRPSMATWRPLPLKLATRTLNVFAANICPLLSAAGTATPARLGTGSPSRRETPMERSFSATKGTGATFSRIGRRWLFLSRVMSPA